jgi:cardiolipin synthase
MKGLRVSLIFLCLSALTAYAGGLEDDIPEYPLNTPGRGKAVAVAVDKAVVEKKARDARLEYERQHWMDEGALPGHKLTLLPTGKESYAHRYEIIEHAQYSIYVSTFSFKTDKQGGEIALRLCERARNGVEVRILVDSRSSKDLESYRKYFEECGNSGDKKRPGKPISLKLYGDAKRWGLDKIAYRLHEKLMIVDGQTVILGGAGISNQYTDYGRHNVKWHDLDLRIDGPAACRFHREYKRNWLDVVKFERPLRFIEKWEKKHWSEIGPKEFYNCEEVVQGDSRVLPIYSNPIFRDGAHPILDHYLKALQATDTEVRLYSPYLIPRPDFIEALLAAKRRGVKIKILTNSPGSNDEGWASMGMYGTVIPLIKEGVEIFLWPKTSTMHRKAGLYDHRWTYIGSDNLDYRGQKQQSETIAFTDDAALVAQMENEMDLDFAGAIPMTVEMAEKGYDSSSWLQRKIFGFIVDIM